MSSLTAGASVFLNFLQSCSVFVTVQYLRGRIWGLCS